jgi:chaperonin GroES
LRNKNPCATASSSRIPPRRSRKRAKSLPPGTARGSKAANWVALGVKVGDRVLFGKYSGNEVKLDVIEYIIMREDDVLTILDSTTDAAKNIT